MKVLFTGGMAVVVIAMGVANADVIIGPSPGIAGQFSLVRLGEASTALGDFCATAGGRKNQAGSDSVKADKTDPSGDPSRFRDHVAIGGGSKNLADAEYSTISGGEKNVIKRSDQYCTISGGSENGSSDVDNVSGRNAPGSVITGGSENSWKPNGSNKGGMTISGGSKNNVFGRNGVVTSGFNNDAIGLNSVVIGGRNNTASGDYSCVGGGENNVASGRNSIAFGQQAYATKDSSMVINLQGVNNRVENDKEGQMLVRASQYRMQISRFAEPENQFTITADNVANLQNAIDSQPGRRRKFRRHLQYTE